MDIVIFEEITTNDYLKELKVESEKYTGLYVDMEDAPQRKYVKDKAHDINQLLKKIDRKRIDTSKEYKIKVEKEASEIIEKLKEANEPFTLLIDAHTAERKKILDKEKARKQAVLDAEKLELDHEIGLLINKTFEYDRQQETKEQMDRDDEIRRQATVDADDRQKQAILDSLQRERNEENARLANVEHCAKVNRKALSDLLEQTDITSQQAKQVIQAIARGRISSTKINY